MNRIAAVAGLVLLFAAPPPAAAQSQPPTPGSETKSMAQEAAPGAPAPATKRRTRSSADARQCLQLATIVEITRCAEKYR